MARPFQARTVLSCRSCGEAGRQCAQGRDNAECSEQGNDAAEIRSAAHGSRRPLRPAILARSFDSRGHLVLSFRTCVAQVKKLQTHGVSSR
jgi:hypothetical protein